jgi:hypothetical protein
MNVPNRREHNRKAFTTPEGMTFLKGAVNKSKDSNEKFKSDPWNNVGKDQRNNYREPMDSVKSPAPKEKK